jgi:hypothetical protein
MADKHYQRALEQVAHLKSRLLKSRLLAAERERDEAVLNAHSYASQILEAQVAANEAEAELATLRAALQALRADNPPTETRGG